jgi:hypothetical protein
MKAYEQKKEGSFERGMVWMIVEGDKEAVRAICGVLDEFYQNDSCPTDDTMYGGKYSEGYVIWREEKESFMAKYKEAKRGVK